jgi:SAM-dependent methyltransferase
MSRPDYGIDAPGVIRTLFLLGAVAIAIGLFAPLLHVRGARPTFLVVGIVFAVEAVLMLLYARFGKFRHRDRMLERIEWKGHEQVLDVGTGRGLLAIGAAKRLTTGRAIGIDIWSAEDLSGNYIENALANAQSEGVGNKIEIRSEDVRQMSFEDATFDIVLSNLCLHNIRSAEEREKACREIARVLKPGGRAIISDFKETSRYAQVLRDLGLEVFRSTPYVMDTFPPLWIVEARKVK